MHETLFSSRAFIEIWTRAVPNAGYPFEVRVRGSGPDRSMYGLQKSQFGLRSILFGPVGLYASPGWLGSLELATVRNILAKLQGPNIRAFAWNVRFDHGELAEALSSLGIRSTHTYTFVLPLQPDYQRVFRGYSETIRNQVRRSRRAQVLVRDARDETDIDAYYHIHLRLARERGYLSIYPCNLLVVLAGMRDAARFLVAEYENRIIGGGLFFRDGDSILYWHGASDRDYSRVFPSCAVLDEAIHWACEEGASSFNFGGSGGIQTLERFKSFWGARPEFNWRFEWSNPLWDKISYYWTRIRGHHA